MTSTPDLYLKFLECTGVSTDTRQITPGCLFVSLKGDQFNGNQFALQALASGARYAVVDEETIAAQNPDQCLLVPDGLTALQDLARHHRQTLTIPVIGLTGSNGKTTTKELIAGVLSKQFTVYATRGNLNNHIGVPLTLLSLNETHEMAVVEMGANHQQEIALLCSIAQPTHGLITNVGKAHLEGFGGIAGVRKGKGELYDYLAQTAGTVFINSRDQTLTAMYRERLKTLRQDAPPAGNGRAANGRAANGRAANGRAANGRAANGFAEAIFYPGEPVELVQESPVVVYRTADGQTVTTHLPGHYNFENMLAALAIGNYLGVPDAESHHAVANYNPTNNRSQVVTSGTNTILLDAYNANPSSMAAAIQQFARQPARRKMVILGDMYELGVESEAEHAALGKLVANSRFDLVILAGQDMKWALGALPNAYYFPDKFSLHNWLIDHPQTDTHILVKGSRGMKLETVVPFL